jgi:hypothetical protein
MLKKTNSGYIEIIMLFPYSYLSLLFPRLMLVQHAGLAAISEYVLFIRLEFYY